VVGAYLDNDACIPVTSFCDSGSAYVFTRSGTTWTEEQKLTASDATTTDRFGFSVAISGDTTVVGASQDDDAGSASGSAYVFTRSGTTWSEQAKLIASDADVGDLFGTSVAVSGGTTVVGAFANDDAGATSGSAYVFTRSGTTWSEQAKLTASDARVDAQFGSSIAVEGDTVVVGAVRDDDGGRHSGSAYVFTRSGATWSQQAKLTASEPAIRDFFGNSVSVSGDTVVVGSNLDDDAGRDSGSAYVFTRSGTTWSEQAKLAASDATARDQFGNSVSVSGGTVVVGARSDDDAGSSSGSAYVFSLIPDTDDDGLQDSFEVDFGGNPPDESILIDNPDTGNTATSTGSAAAGSNVTSGELRVQFPAGTSVDLSVDSKIFIKFDSDGYPTNPNALPKVEIKAADLAGQTKTVEMPIGNGNFICIVDQSAAKIESLDTSSCSGTNTTEIPIPTTIGDKEMASGTAEPSIPTTYTVTRISSTHVTVDGMIHTAVGSYQDSDFDTVRDADDICPNTPQGAEVILSESVLGCTPTQGLQSVIDELNSIVSENPGTSLADKVEDVLATTQNALFELNKTPPNSGAAAGLGSIEGAIGSLEDAIKDEGLDPVQGEQLINQLLDISRQIAVNAIDTAVNTPGSDAGKISSANAALANGDSLRTPPTSFGDFKDAAAEYKVAIAEAEGALP